MSRHHQRAVGDPLIKGAFRNCAEEQLAGFLVGAAEALQGGEPASIVGVVVEVVVVDAGPDARTGLTARVRRDCQTYDVALADLTFDADSQLGRIVAAYRRWQGRTP